MIRSVPASKSISQFLRRLIAGSCLVALPFAAVAEDLRLSADAARALALQALQQGDPATAAQIAQGLLQRDPDDGMAHFTLARAFQQMRQPGKGRRSARLAFRHAGGETDKFHAAQLAARLAVEDNSPTAAQVWLRRSLLHVPDPRMRPRIEKDYRILRQLSPWQFGLSLSFAPSSNLNNGADSPYSLIDGVPVVGYLSGSAQALSGLRASADASVSYRLSQSKSQATRMSFRAFGQRVHLSDEAREIAPDVSNSDLAFNYLELGLNQQRKAQNGGWTFGAALGQSWSGGEKYQQSKRLHLSRRLPVGDASLLGLTGQLEHIRHDSGLADIRGLTLSTRLSHRSDTTGDWQVSLSLKTEDSDNANATRNRVDGQINWSPRKSKATAMIHPTLSLGASWQHYADFTVGLPVPGGREDETLFGQVEFTLQALDYGGFVPSLRVQARKTDSNVSRYDTRETTVSFGIKSAF
jgi:hypothetical protein